MKTSGTPARRATTALARPSIPAPITPTRCGCGSACWPSAQAWTAACDRLGERCDVERDAAGGIQTALRNGNSLCEPTGAMNADERPRSAHVLEPAATEVTPVTRDQRVDHDRFAGVRTDTGYLVPHDQRRNAERALVAKPFQFRPTDADRLDVDDNLPRSGEWLGNLLKLEGQWGCIDNRSHLSPLSERLLDSRQNDA